MIFAPFSAASQSSIFARANYSSSQQLSALFAGIWGLTEKSHINAGFAHSRVPLQDLDNVDTYYQGSFGAAHSIDNVAFDVGFIGSYSPLAAITTKGGYFGLTYVYSRSIRESIDASDRALSLLHTQIYPAEDPRPPLFWIRAGFSGNTMSSSLREPPNNKAKGTVISIDAYHPLEPTLLLGAGVAFYGYDAAGREFFAETQRNATSLRTALLSANVTGLPKTSAHANATIFISNRDYFLPRYAIVEIDSTRQLTHTLTLGWRHQFNKSLYLTPSYDLTIQADRSYTSLGLELMYTL